MWPQWQGQHHSTAAGEQHVQQPSQPEAFPVRPCSVPLLSEDTWGHLPAWDECWVLSCSSIPPVCGFQGGLELWGSLVGLQPTGRAALHGQLWVPLSHNRCEIPPVLLPG